MKMTVPRNATVTGLSYDMKHVEYAVGPPNDELRKQK
jgi:hypothetical protein